jgi:hypothetical protein
VAGNILGKSLIGVTSEKLDTSFYKTSQLSIKYQLTNMAANGLRFNLPPSLESTVLAPESHWAVEAVAPRTAAPANKYANDFMF